MVAFIIVNMITESIFHLFLFLKNIRGLKIGIRVISNNIYLLTRLRYS